MKVCLLDMDERTRQSMALVLRHRGDGAIVLSDVGAADIAVLDLDHENAPQAFEQIRARRPALQAIGPTARPGVGAPGHPGAGEAVSAGSRRKLSRSTPGIELLAAKIPAAGAAAALGARGIR